MNRRVFLQLAGLIGFLLDQGALVRAQETSRVRYNAGDARASNDLDAMALAVRQMLKNSDALDPMSWMYWANVHGMTNENIPPNLINIWASCDHGDYFLAWHRLYLLAFESVIARISGKKDFALPYWDWYSSLDLPGRFIVPADSENPLWRPDRTYSKRYGVSTRALQIRASENYFGFNRLSFGDPHSNIHVNFRGEMAAPSTAARDPIFWAHHAAMDRLWELWRFGPKHTNPLPDAPWSQKEFFFSSNSSTKTRVRDVLDPLQLGYRYDSLTVSLQEARTPPRPELTERAATSTGKESQQQEGATILGELRNLTLNGDSKTIQFKLPESAPRQLESIRGEIGAPPRLFLVLEAAHVTQQGAEAGFVYDIYINLPRTAQLEAVQERGDRHYVGQISSFSLIAHHHLESSNIRIPLDELIGELRIKGAWSPDQVEISFVEQSPLVASSPLITINSLHLQIISGSQ